MKRMLAILLAAMMLFSVPTAVFGTDGTGSGTTQSIEQTQPADTTEAADDDQLTDEEQDSSTVTEEENVQPDDEKTPAESSKQVKKAKSAAAGESEDEIDYSKWTSEDFTYGDYEKLLYGCDYERQFTISGKVITGFSESGEKKLEKNKDLVIPATDDKGETIVGVGEGAFREKGLTSVTFPTGMMVDYDDTVTNRVTKRGNFIIAESAFAKNELTEVDLPEGVIAVLPSAFQMNKIETVKLPRTIWWIETQAFARNMITEVSFPTTCDFQLEMHGMSFANNFIESVRLPDFTEVVNKEVFAWNTGMEAIADDAKDSYKTYEGADGEQHDAGVVYMYTDNAELELKDRIHHTGKATASLHSDVQKLVINDGSEETQNPNQEWTIDDFTVNGTTVTGLSESGIAKRAENKDLVIPDMTKDGRYITEIAAAEAGGTGLFATEDEKFDTVQLPNELEKIGNFAFQNNSLDEVQFPARLKEIGISAFAMNDLTSVILPDTVTTLGGGAFATNPKLERISLSKGLTEIPAGAFGCSDQKNYMTNLTSIEIPEGITSIGSNAFAGNNFHEIEIPASVKEIGSYAFSTKEYLTDPCTLTLNEGLETIGNRAFRNKTIAEVTLPASVTKIGAQTFEKVYSSGADGVQTKVYVSLKSQYEDTKNFPSNDYQKMYLTDASVWTAEDFTYGTESFALYQASNYSSAANFTDMYVVTGLSDMGLEKIESNKALSIPAKDPDGKKIQGVGSFALDKLGIVSLTLPETERVANDKGWTPNAANEDNKRGNFFIGSSAFLGNELTTLEIPEGVIYIGGNAFKSNGLTAVTFPSTIMMVGNAAFGQNSISSLSFTETTDFALNLDNMCFAINQIKSVQLPVQTEKITKWAFLQNTGMEEVTSGTAAEKKGGIVYMYVDGETGSFIDHTGNGGSKVQKLINEAIPAKDAPWGVDDFTYDGTTITGLSEAGQAKIKVNGALILPKQNPDGEDITALGAGAALKGIFVYDDGDKLYSPESIILPSTLEEIGNLAFVLNASAEYEREMTSIAFPDGLKKIGQTAFQNSKLTSVSLPDSVTELGVAAFTGSGDITSIKLSTGLKEIPQSAFAAGTATDMKLASLTVPEGVETIGMMAFTGTHVESLTLPSTLKVIDNQAFMNHQLTSLEIPAGVTEIGTSAFSIKQEELSNKITSLTLNEGLVTIGKTAFAGNSITEVDLPSTVVLSNKNTSADGIFGDKSTPAKPVVTLKTSDKESVEKYNTEYANSYSHKVVYDKLVGTGWEEDDFTYDEDTGTITGWSDSGNQKRLENHELVLPDKTPGGKDIVAIGDNAFEIPDDEITVTKFGIESPNGMTSVDLPEKLEKIGDRAFSQNALNEVDLEGLKSIGESAFYGNKLEKVEIPDTVTELGKGAFATNNITELKLSSGVTKIPQGAFSMNIRLEHVTIPDTVTEIGDTAFAGARLTELTIPESVVKIGFKAFHLHHLKELTIPGNVKEIGESAFEGTYKATTLTKLTIEEGVETIGKRAFKEALLETVHFPDSIKSVGEELFLNNKGKDGSHVVEVTTKNKAHTAFEDETYEIRLLTIDITCNLKGLTLDGPETAAYNEDYTATLKAKSGYALPESITVEVNGSKASKLRASSYTYDNETGELVISGDVLTGDVTGVTITASGKSIGGTTGGGSGSGDQGGSGQGTAATPGGSAGSGSGNNAGSDAASATGDDMNVGLLAMIAAAAAAAGAGAVFAGKRRKAR